MFWLQDVLLDLGVLAVGDSQQIGCSGTCLMDGLRDRGQLEFLSCRGPW